MQAFAFAEFGLDHLKRVSYDRPSPGPGQVLLELAAVSLNYRDLLMVEGKYNPRQKLPLVPCSDGAGTVIATGPGVRLWKEGDQLLPLFSESWHYGRPDRSMLKSSLGGPLPGTLRQFMVASELACVRAPAHLNLLEASTLPCAALTAWSALVKEASIGPGSTVLILGTGGVSLFALQFCRLLGARAIVTSKSQEKLERIKELAWATIDYSAKAAWEREVLRLTDGSGVDLVIEVGGQGTLEKSIKSVRPGGTISLIGVLAGSAGGINLLPVLMQNIRIQGIVVGHKQSFEEMILAMEMHNVKPMIDRMFPFAESPEAFSYLKSAEHMGKICIEVKSQ